MNKNYAFVSYSHKNRTVVKEFVYALRNRSVNIWFDSDIDYGREWDSIIMSKLCESTVVFVFVSKELAESKYCTKEFDIAVEMHKTIIPILLDIFTFM